MNDIDREEQDAIHRAVSAMMLHPDTRKFLGFLLREGKALGSQPFTGDALTTAFGCGEMQLGYRVLEAVLGVGPAHLVKLLEEMEDDRRRREARRPVADDSPFGDESAGADEWEPD